MLTDEQLQQVDRYVATRNLPYYDVRLEIADHLGEQVLTAMNKNGLSFEAALQQQGAIFQKDWATIVQSKAKHLRRQILRALAKEILGFFIGPKITLTLAVTALVILVDRYNTFKAWFMDKNAVLPNKLFLYFFPLSLIVWMAWAQTRKTFRNNIHKNYPGFI